MDSKKQFTLNGVSRNESKTILEKKFLRLLLVLLRETFSIKKV